MPDAAASAIGDHVVELGLDQLGLVLDQLGLGLVLDRRDDVIEALERFGGLLRLGAGVVRGLDAVPGVLRRRGDG